MNLSGSQISKKTHNPVENEQRPGFLRSLSLMDAGAVENVGRSELSGRENTFILGG